MPDENKGTSKEDRLKNLQGFWQVALNSYNPWSIIAKEDLDFYFGGEKQWASADLQLLKQQKRPVLTFNHLLSLVNLVSGYQRQNRQDIKVYNRKGGSKNVADILTEIIKHIHDNCYGDWETSMAFVMGLIAGGANTVFAAVANMSAGRHLNQLPLDLILPAVLLPIVFGALAQVLSFRRTVRQLA